MARQVVYDDDDPVPEVGHEHLADISFESVAVDRLLTTMGAAMPVMRSPATSVVVLRWLSGGGQSAAARPGDNGSGCGSCSLPRTTDRRRLAVNAIQRFAERCGMSGSAP